MSAMSPTLHFRGGEGFLSEDFCVIEGEDFFDCSSNAAIRAPPTSASDAGPAQQVQPTSVVGSKTATLMTGWSCLQPA